MLLPQKMQKKYSISDTTACRSYLRLLVVALWNLIICNVHKTHLRLLLPWLTAKDLKRNKRGEEEVEKRGLQLNTPIGWLIINHKGIDWKIVLPFFYYGEQGGQTAFLTFVDASHNVRLLLSTGMGVPQKVFLFTWFRQQQHKNTG